MTQPVKGTFGNSGIEVGNPPTQYFDLSMRQFVLVQHACGQGLDSRGVVHQFLPGTWLTNAGTWMYFCQDPKETIDHKLSMDLFSHYASVGDLVHLKAAYDVYFSDKPQTGFFAWLRSLFTKGA
jgi:hypothetical protein